MKMSDLKLAKEENKIAGHELKYNKEEWNFCQGQPTNALVESI